MATAVEKRATRKPKAKSVKTSVHCTIVNDWVGGCGQTGEEETEQIKQHVQLALKGRAVVFKTCDTMSPHLKTDLLVFDYGGMANGYSSPFWDYCRKVVKWAEDHPSSLVVIGSSFTYDNGIQRELLKSIDVEDDGIFGNNRRPWNGSSLYWQSPLANMIIGYLISPIWKGEELSDSEKAIKEWFA